MGTLAVRLQDIYAPELACIGLPQGDEFEASFCGWMHDSFTNYFMWVSREEYDQAVLRWYGEEQSKGTEHMKCNFVRERKLPADLVRGTHGNQLFFLKSVSCVGSVVFFKLGVVLTGSKSYFSTVLNRNQCNPPIVRRDCSLMDWPSSLGQPTVRPSTWVEGRSRAIPILP